MKLYTTFLTLLCFAILLLGICSCERDDICAEGTPTTPLLIVKFFDFDTKTEIKAPSELQVRAVGIDSFIDIGTVRDSIFIPLRTNSSSTAFEFTINSDTTNNAASDLPPNTDRISFQYTPVEEYVSSACGFRVVYDGLTFSDEDPGTAGDWIREISIRRRDILDETDAHILIFH
ncbi:hypothetical protein J8281_11485 [Aquimarina sp. U1-2]|uniref:DUF6452 family protein n=1 Tax=Aquimarina sp. U1-2 TaxID=2823141 RepID=UPI001AECBF33|nr:DUF6452 family protein [Aquimarina sp. U1-2]MBP2832809.1 hypothetical protein [Aquimarina sp. U1-2]